ncbi:hypothetical protein NTGBS_950047 [Candidatus Nitrotoga sp. BS]|nr:hypothetical protein NTGBS_950047 [Candidatus Nitrotoga sp. BS]
MSQLVVEQNLKTYQMFFSIGLSVLCATKIIYHLYSYQVKLDNYEIALMMACGFYFSYLGQVQHHFYWQLSYGRAHNVR